MPRITRQALRPVFRVRTVRLTFGDYFDAGITPPPPPPTISYRADSTQFTVDSNGFTVDKTISIVVSYRADSTQYTVDSIGFTVDKIS
jgi:hypothetical protein